jgi:putative SOS response-associated peptidase YedK
MCASYTPARSAAVLQMTDQQLTPTYPEVTFPGYAAPLIRKTPGGQIEASTGLFGLIPVWAKARNFGKYTYNARSETVAEKPSFRAAWRQARLCLVPMHSFFEPCWDSGHAVKWRIGRSDGQAFTVAGLWEQWTDPATGEITLTHTLLTVNATGHPVMGRFHRPTDEKRSLVYIAPEQRLAWLSATVANAQEFLHALPSDFSAAAAEPERREPSTGTAQLFES